MNIVREIVLSYYLITKELKKKKKKTDFKISGKIPYPEGTKWSYLKFKFYLKKKFLFKFSF